MDRTENRIDVSIVIPVSERWHDFRELYGQYSEALSAIRGSREFIFVIDGANQEIIDQLAKLRGEHPEIQIIVLNRWVGEATALSVGFEHARGKTIVTLPSYVQVEPSDIPGVVDELAKGERDLVITRRHPRVDSLFNQWQGRVFHWVVRRLTGTPYRDVSCGVRAMKRVVADEVQLYGDLHRFFPILAYERGFRVFEKTVRQSDRDAPRKFYHPGVYLRRLLDILTLFFLFKFTKKPLRFFGLIGTGLGAVGLAITGYLGLYRILGLGAIAGRPLLILGVLLIVLGVQLFSIGLLGEILIFTHGRRRKDYTVDEYIK